MRPLQGNHNMFCDIHIFSATTTTTAKALHFSIQELTIVRCSGHMQVKFCIVFLVQRKFCVAFSCENKIFRVFLWYNVCNNFFFGVQLVQRKYLWRFYVLKLNSAARFSLIETKQLFSDQQSTAESMCVFRRGRKAEMLSWTRWYKNCHNSSSLQFFNSKLGRMLCNSYSNRLWFLHFSHCWNRRNKLLK